MSNGISAEDRLRAEVELLRTFKEEAVKQLRYESEWLTRCEDPYDGRQIWGCLYCGRTFEDPSDDQHRPGCPLNLAQRHESMDADLLVVDQRKRHLKDTLQACIPCLNGEIDGYNVGVRRRDGGCEIRVRYEFKTLDTMWISDDGVRQKPDVTKHNAVSAVLRTIEEHRRDDGCGESRGWWEWLWGTYLTRFVGTVRV